MVFILITIKNMIKLNILCNLEILRKQMRINRIFLVLIGTIAGALCQTNGYASLVNCPAGCFCLGDGKYNTDNDQGDIEFWCGVYSATAWNPEGCTGNTYGDIVIKSSSNCGGPATYYLDQFSEFYDGRFGFYGFIDNEFVYGYRKPSDFAPGASNNNYDIFQCPYTHPHSETGADALTDCFKYDANGNKIYYEIQLNTTNSGSTPSVPKITCAKGTYLPANATVCEACLPNKHHICPGGSFYQRYAIQGLKVQCAPGQYLKQGATQCSSCESKYLCLGGTYQASMSKDQGYIINNGYIFNDGRNVQKCEPGYYMPGSSQTCVACTGNYACPGGLFYTDGQYITSRGRIFCGYGHANDTHTACISTSTWPSYMLQLIEEQQNEPERSTAQTQSVEKKQQSQQQQTPQRLSSGKRQSGQSQHLSKQMVSAAKTPAQTIATLEQQTAPAPQAEDKLETAKKLISSGVAIPVQ